MSTTAITTAAITGAIVASSMSGNSETVSTVPPAAELIMFIVANLVFLGGAIMFFHTAKTEYNDSGWDLFLIGFPTLMGIVFLLINVVFWIIALN